MRRTKEDAAITRAQLLKAAMHIFSTKGYSETTLDDIARQAGTTRGAIHWHFGNKAELFNTLIRESYERAWTRLQDVYTTGGTPLELLRHILMRWLSYPEENAEFRAVLELTMFKTGPVTDELAKGMQEKQQGTQASLKYFTALIEKGIASGEIRAEVNPEVAAITAMSLIYGVDGLWLTNPGAFSLKSIAAETIDLFIRGIAIP